MPKNKTILAFFGVLIFAASAMLLFIKYQEKSLNSPEWVLKNLWGSDYVRATGGKLEYYDEIFIASLNDGDNQRVLDFVWKNKCRDGSEKCYVVMASAANILINSFETDSGLTALVEAKNRREDKNSCPIIYELSIIRYKIKTLENTNNRPNDLALSLLRKIKRSGGIIEDVRIDACLALAKEKPELFRAYALMIAQIMSFAGGTTTDAGRKINNAIGI
ncbi:hypothetical protein [Pseudomonas sp. TMP9]|uniref:hypothetical protein n=1 Tax=Pseudomonas sp. TMP9 TaxID=3133144 RepID=UPI0030CE062F